MSIISKPLSPPEEMLGMKYWNLPVISDEIAETNIASFRLYTVTATTLEAISPRTLKRKLRVSSPTNIIGIDSLTLLRVWKETAALDALRQLCQTHSTDIVACLGQFAKGKFTVSEPHHRQARRNTNE